MKKMAIALLICVILCTSLITVSAQPVQIIDRIATYQVYYPLFGWTTQAGPQVEYRTIAYNGDYQFVRAEPFCIIYDAGLFTGRIIGTQYIYQ
jgi:hypothetical protein